VYVLHYVEDFIRESISPDFSIVTSEGGPRFTNPHFAQEVSAKREDIQNLIRELSNNPQERAARSMDIEPKPQPRAPVVHTPRPQRPKRQNKPSLSKKWNEKETSVLLNRLLEGGRIHKGTKGRTHWDLISEDIHTKCETIRSEDECRRRFDTLLKAYRKIEKTGKPFDDITKAGRAELNLATPLTEEWYKAIDRICSASPGNAKSQKRPKLDPNDGNGMVSSSPPNPTPPLVPSQLPKLEKPSRKQVVRSSSPDHFCILICLGPCFVTLGRRMVCCLTCLCLNVKLRICLSIWYDCCCEGTSIVAYVRAVLLLECTACSLCILRVLQFRVPCSLFG
jgi:hypothetical protein